MTPQSNNASAPVRRIILTGAPGTGKSTVVQALEAQGFSVMKEVSREYWDETGYGTGGSDPWRNLIAFSRAIWKLRAEQHKSADWLSGSVFYDRSLLDILAYMDAGDKVIPEDMNPSRFPYHSDVFIFPPWEEIYQMDEGRWEPFETCHAIHESLKRTYEAEGYSLIEVPPGTVEERVAFMLQYLRDH
jgi:predicted ATPase